MTGLDGIGVRVEFDNAEDASTGNLLPVLHQVRHALADLARQGETTLIDLAGIPFAPGETDRLFELLGDGEVDATIDALGRTRVRETAYPGVWIVQHRAPDGSEIGTLIEVTRIPTLLATPEDDVPDSRDKLAAALDALEAGTGRPPSTQIPDSQE